MATPTLNVENLTVRYGADPAVNRVSFKIPRGKLVFLVGPNGSGKSSLLTAILGLTPYTGQVRLGDKPVSAVYHSIGYVPQRFSFDRSIPLTVRELLTLTLTLCDCAPITAKDTEEHLKKALAQVGGAAWMDKTLGSLSGGQLQRVLLARALVHHPSLIILDEPESGVDERAGISLYTLLRRLVDEQQLTIILASHEISAAKKYADLVLALNGQLAGFGSPDKVLTPNLLKDLFTTS